MSSEEEDYMSDKYLGQSGSSEISRPGLIKSKIIDRHLKLHSKKLKHDKEIKLNNKSKTIIEKELRESGLNKEISSDNKGFAMLTKMGYKKGEGIGKTSSGITKPIPIAIKTDRAGLGREAALKQLRDKKLEIRNKKLLAASQKHIVTADEYRNRLTKIATEKQLEIDLRKCQTACEGLDIRENISNPPVIWFWPVRKTQTDDNSDKDTDSSDDEEEEDIFTPVEKLEMIVEYLRTTYLYCNWCGIRYTDITDINNNCPGLTKDEH